MIARSLAFGSILVALAACGSTPSDSTGQPADASASKGGAAAAPAFVDSGFYAEERKLGPRGLRYYVFGKKESHAHFLSKGTGPVSFQLMTGSGPEGETVVVETDPKDSKGEMTKRLLAAFAEKHGVKM